MTVTLAMLGSASIAHAQPSDREKTLATTLFDDAKALLTEGKVPEACRMLEESRRLDPLPGTILNLAVCHEREGLMASALAEFREARLLADRDGRRDRVALADEHMKAIEPRLSQLVVVVVGTDADRAGLRITRDATPLERAAWGLPIPVDPGEHIVLASAPGKKTRRIAVTVGREADVQTAVVAALENEESADPTPPAVIAPVPARGTTQLDTPAAAPTGLSTRRTLAIASAGLGVVALGVGSYYGARAFSKHGDPAATCTTTPCSSESLSLNDQAKFAADAATVSFAVALVAIGGAAFLWFGDTPRRATAQVRLSPAFGPGRSSVDLSGDF